MLFSGRTAAYSNVSVLSSKKLRQRRTEVISWARSVNGAQNHQHSVGGVITFQQSPARRCLKSLTSGEVRCFPSDPRDIDETSELFEWAREEIMCAYEAGVACLVFDEIGPEVLSNSGLDAALRACLWKAHEEDNSSCSSVHFLVLVEESLRDQFASLYSIDPAETNVLSSWEHWLSTPPAKRCSRGRVASYSSDFEASFDNRHSPYGTGVVYAVMRFPLLLGTMFVMAVELLFYVLIRQIVAGWETLFSSNWRIRRKMAHSTHYASWRRLARQLDVLEAKQGGSIRHIPALYALWKRLEELVKNFEEGQVPIKEHEILTCLRECCMASQNQLIDEHAYSINHTGTNVQLRAYRDCMFEALDLVASCQDPGKLNFRNYTGARRASDSFSSCAGEGTKEHVPRLLVDAADKDGTEKDAPDRAALATAQSSPGELDSFRQFKRRYFAELYHSYGEVALCLSGGAGNAFYHLGVAQCLLESDLLPRHVTGASGGALIGSFLCTHTDEELRDLMRAEVLCKIFNPCEEGLWNMMRRAMFTGTVFDVGIWAHKLQNQVCGNLTFQEAYERTGRSFTITVFNIDARGKNHTRCLNHRTTPDVVIYSAVLASSALPGLLPPIELLKKGEDGTIQPYHSFGKFWRDGSFENEIPLDALHHLFNTSFTLVSQVEPHIIPFFFDNRGAAGKSVRHRKGRGWRGGFLLSYLEKFLKLDLKKWLELVRHFNLLPKVMDTDMSAIFLGRFKGSCTMVAPVVPNSYFNLVRDPDTPARMGVYLNGGRHMIWPKLPMIKDHICIERRLRQLALCGAEEETAHTR